MRWTDKPRKKTRREIVLEYIKFMKIMGYYPKLVGYMYSIAREKRPLIYLRNRYEHSDIVCHNQFMIDYFITTFRKYNRSSKLSEHFIREFLIKYPLRMWDFNESWNLTYLLMSYFKEKHIANCIVVDD